MKFEDYKIFSIGRKMDLGWRKFRPFLLATR
jgi:hypothetical protein